MNNIRPDEFGKCIWKRESRRFCRTITGPFAQSTTHSKEHTNIYSIFFKILKTTKEQQLASFRLPSHSWDHHLKKVCKNPREDKPHWNLKDARDKDRRYFREKEQHVQRPRDNRQRSIITEVKDTRRNFRNGWEAGKSHSEGLWW